MLIINNVKNVGADVMHSGYGALKIGSNVWNPIAGAVWTTPTGTLIDMHVFSYIDRYPLQLNRYPPLSFIHTDE